MAGPSKNKLVLVYNADEGLIALLKDALHKLLKPQTYPCSLCMISYGAVSMRGPWKQYLNGLPMEKLFFHRQDFARAYPGSAGIPLPAILVDQGDEPLVLLSSDQLDRIKDVESLVAAMDLQLSAFAERNEINLRSRHAAIPS